MATNVSHNVGLIVVWAATKIRGYIEDLSFTVQTDYYQPPKWLMSKISR